MVKKMTVPVAAILYKLRVMYPSYKFEIKHSAVMHLHYLYVYSKGEMLGSKSFEPETPLDKFWETIKCWMQTIVR